MSGRSQLKNHGYFCNIVSYCYCRQHSYSIGNFGNLILFEGPFMRRISLVECYCPVCIVRSWLIFLIHLLLIYHFVSSSFFFNSNLSSLFAIMHHASCIPSCFVHVCMRSHVQFSFVNHRGV